MLDWLDYVKADFRRFYQITDIYELESVEFFRLAYALQIYGIGTFISNGERNIQVPNGMVAWKFFEIEDKRKKANEDRVLGDDEAMAFAMKNQPR